MARSKKTLEEKIREELPEFAETVASLSVTELNNRLSTLAKDGERIQQALEDDEELEQAKAHTSELAAPYREGKKHVRLKTKYVISLIKEKGGDA